MNRRKSTISFLIRLTFFFIILDSTITFTNYVSHFHSLRSSHTTTCSRFTKNRLAPNTTTLLTYLSNWAHKNKYRTVSSNKSKPPFNPTTKEPVPSEAEWSLVTFLIRLRYKHRDVYCYRCYERVGY